MDESELINNIDNLLPQTQCQQCGYAGCRPYAEAIVKDNINHNLCLPGSTEVMQQLALLLARPLLPIPQYKMGTIYIDESLCIGCMACIRVCPVDAIVGSTKLMHTVINQECTGCNLCVERCPVDCMFSQIENVPFLPKNNFLGNAVDLRIKSAEHAKTRFNNRNLRLAKLRRNKRTYVPTHTQKITVPATSESKINNLLNLAKKRANERKSSRVEIEDPQLAKQRILEKQQRAAYRKAQMNFRYGNAEEKAQALKYLQKWKEEKTIK